MLESELLDVMQDENESYDSITSCDLDFFKFGIALFGGDAWITFLSIITLGSITFTKNTKILKMRTTMLKMRECTC